jgi:hypothetical protein
MFSHWNIEGTAEAKDNPVSEVCIAMLKLLTRTW